MAVFIGFANFLKSILITFLYFFIQLLGDAIDQLSIYGSNGTSYDESLYEINIVSHIWPFSLPDKI